MAEIDTSIYKPAERKSVMERFGETADTASAFVKNRLLQMEQGSREGIGAAVTDAVGPDGSLDANRLIRSAPKAGYQAPALLKDALSLQGTGMEIAGKGMDAVKARWLSRANSAGAKDYGGYVEDVANLISSGEVSPAVGAAALRMIPRGAKELKAFGLQMGVAAMSPESQNAIVEGPRDQVTGQPTKVTAGQAATMALGGREPAADASAAAPAAPAAPGFASGLPPGEEEAMKAAGDLLAQDRTQAASFKQRTYALSNAIPLLEKLGPTGTGPGSEAWNDVKTFLQSWGVPGIDGDKVNVFNEARKFLTQNVMTSGDTNTNDKLAAAFSGNPNLHLDQASNVDLAKSMLSMLRLKQAQVLAFEQSGLPANQYAKWAGKWNPSQDARAYGWDMMTPEQREKVWKSLPDEAARTAFKSTVAFAKKADLFNMKAPSNGGK